MFLLYILFVLLRYLSAFFSKGYIHPDEFLQGPQIISSEIYPIRDAFIPWEFKDCPPNRSILPLFLFIGAPLYLLKHLFGVTLNERILLLLPKLTVTTFSFLIGQQKPKKKRSLFQFQTEFFFYYLKRKRLGDL